MKQPVRDRNVCACLAKQMSSCASVLIITRCAPNWPRVTAQGCRKTFFENMVIVGDPGAMMSAIPGRPFAGPEKPPSKRAELAQARAKIDAAQEEVRQHRTYAATNVLGNSKSCQPDMFVATKERTSLSGIRPKTLCCTVLRSS